MLSQVSPALNPSREQFAILSESTLIALGEKCSRAEILTLQALALHADPHGHCWPGRARLAQLTGLDPTRVSKATRGLERKGFLTKTHGEPHATDYYILRNRSSGDTAPLPTVPPEASHSANFVTQTGANFVTQNTPAFEQIKDHRESSETGTGRYACGALSRIATPDQDPSPGLHPVSMVGTGSYTST